MGLFSIALSDDPKELLETAKNNLLLIDFNHQYDYLISFAKYHLNIMPHKSIISEDVEKITNKAQIINNVNLVLILIDSMQQSKITDSNLSWCISQLNEISEYLNEIKSI